MTIFLKKIKKEKLLRLQRIISSTLWPLPNEIKSKKSIFQIILQRRYCHYLLIIDITKKILNLCQSFINPKIMNKFLINNKQNWRSLRKFDKLGAKVFM